jgi:hypothetical protein
MVPRLRLLAALVLVTLWTGRCVSDGRPPPPELDPTSDHTQDSPQPMSRSLAGEVPPEARPLEPGPAPSPAEGPSTHQHGGGAAAAVSGAMYSCPMHPEVRQATPGECPKCGMRLVQEAGPVDAGSPVPQKKAEPSPKPRAAPAAKVYTCSMHPEVRQPAPGRCPKCGMKLEPAEEGHEGHR